MSRKVINIDTNLVDNNGYIYIHEIIAKCMHLSDGESVIAYQDEDEWDGEIFFDNGQYLIKLISDVRTIPLERQRGHMEGFSCGRYVQTAIIFNILDEMNLDYELRYKIEKRLGL